MQLIAHNFIVKILYSPPPVANQYNRNSNTVYYAYAKMYEIAKGGGGKVVSARKTRNDRSGFRGTMCL